MVCYWKGLPEGQNSIRVDVVRHFECVPRTALKDLLTVARPYSNEESLKVASRIGPVVPVMHSSTLQAADYVKNQAMGEIQGGGKAKTLGARIAKKLGGITQGPMGRLLEGAVDMGAAAMFGPEAGIATAAMF